MFWIFGVNKLFLFREGLFLIFGVLFGVGGDDGGGEKDDKLENEGFKVVLVWRSFDLLGFERVVKVVREFEKLCE